MKGFIQYLKTTQGIINSLTSLVLIVLIVIQIMMLVTIHV